MTKRVLWVLALPALVLATVAGSSMGCGDPECEQAVCNNGEAFQRCEFCDSEGCEVTTKSPDGEETIATCRYADTSDPGPHNQCVNETNGETEAWCVTKPME